MRFNDNERMRFLAADSPTERKVIIREAQQRERDERAERRHENAILRSLQRFVDEQKR